MATSADDSDLTMPAVEPLLEDDSRWLRAGARQRLERAIRAAECRVSTVTQRFVVDTMAYYRLVETAARWEHVARLCLAGHLELIMTDVQHEQISDHPDVETVVRVLSLPATLEPTFGLVLGVSRPNMARFGDLDLLARLRAPGDDNMPVWPERPRTPRARESRRPQLRSRDTGDALLAATAYYERAVFVTRDDRISKRAVAVGIPVWTPDRFIDRIDTLTL